MLNQQGDNLIKDSTNSLTKSDKAELAELQAELESLEREVMSLRSNLSAAENQVKTIKSSITYRVGVLVVNSRSWRGLVRLPWRLFQMYRQFRRVSPGYSATKLDSVSDEAALESLDTRPDFSRFWIAFDGSEGSFTRTLCRSEEEDGLEVEVPIDSPDGQLVFFLPLARGPRDLNVSQEWSASVTEFGPNEECYRTEISTPICGLRSYHAFVGDGPFALAFAYQIHSQSAGKVQLRFEAKAGETKQQAFDTFSEIRWHKFKPGISVVLPTYQGLSTIGRCLDSLLNQTLAADLFEVIVIQNGPEDGTKEFLESFQEEHHAFNLSMVKATVSGAGNARNLGIEVARREYLTFIDDDDYVSENFLSELLQASSPDAVAIATVLDVNDQGVVSDNVINQQLTNAKNYSVCAYKDVSSVLTMNACKSVPTFLAMQIRYDTSMQSGEDVCFFSRYFSRYSPKLKLEPVNKGASYYRVLTENSVSRRPLSFEFNVAERLAVIKAIDACYPFVRDENKRSFLVSKMLAQSNFVRSYLDNHRGDFSRYAALLQGVPINFGYDNQIAASLSNTLVYSYCFAPYLDTAGIVMAKRVQARGVPVDVICNQMEGVRKADRRLDLITAGLVGRKVVLGGQPSFSNWTEIKNFCDQAEKRLKELEKSRPEYRNIYSRAMWVASHFAAALHKLSHPNVHWRAEFSDPLLKDVQGENREVELEISWLKRKGVFSALESVGITPIETKNLFQWAEFLVYALADEIVFTNENQYSYMIGYSDLPISLRTRVEHRSVVEHHPTLPSSFYGVASPSYTIDSGFINCAYFGSFYVNRGLGEVFEALRYLKRRGVLSFKLHIFTNNASEARLEARNQEVSDCVIVNDYVGYYEFLALTNRFDCLLVNDANTKGLKEVNPYLPSKLSDYLGSSSMIWTLCEEGSVMHSLSVADDTGRIITSFCGDRNSHVQALELLDEKRLS